MLSSSASLPARSLTLPQPTVLLFSFLLSLAPVYPPFLHPLERLSIAYSRPEEICEKLYAEGCLPLLLALFKGEDDNLQAMSARALRNLTETGILLLLLILFTVLIHPSQKHIHRQPFPTSIIPLILTLLSEANRQYLQKEGIIPLVLDLLPNLEGDDNLIGECFGLIQALTVDSPTPSPISPLIPILY